MKRGYSIAIDATKLYKAFGGLKVPNVASDPMMLQQAEDILEGNLKSIKPAVFSTMNTNDDEFLYFEEHEFSFAPEVTAPNGFYAAPNTADNNKILQAIWPQEGQRFLEEIAEIRRKALVYYREEHPKAKSKDQLNKTFLFLNQGL